MHIFIHNSLLSLQRMGVKNKQLNGNVGGQKHLVDESSQKRIAWVVQVDRKAMVNEITIRYNPREAEQHVRMHNMATLEADKQQQQKATRGMWGYVGQF